MFSVQYTCSSTTLVKLTRMQFVSVFNQFYFPLNWLELLFIVLHHLILFIDVFQLSVSCVYVFFWNIQSLFFFWYFWCFAHHFKHIYPKIQDILNFETSTSQSEVLWIRAGPLGSERLILTQFELFDAGVNVSVEKGETQVWWRYMSLVLWISVSLLILFIHRLEHRQSWKSQ